MSEKKYFKLELATGSDIPARDTIGGIPFLSPDLPWPECSCGRKMALFLQFEIKPEHELPFTVGSQFLMFMCPVHNDCAEQWPEGELPEGYGNDRRLFSGENPGYEMYLCSDVSPTPEGGDAFLKRQALRSVPVWEVVDDSDDITPRGREALKIGGFPSWAQETVRYQCSCGGEMAFLCQIPLDFPFPKAESAPEQPNSFSSDDYCLFLGNETYVFACVKQCTPRSLVAVCQN